MSEHVFTKGKFEDSVSGYLSPTGHRCHTGGITIMAMPPGLVNLDITFTNDMLNVIPTGQADYLSFNLNGKRMKTTNLQSQGVNFFRGGSEMSLNCINKEWELLLEFDPKLIQQLFSEQLEHSNICQIDYIGGINPTAAFLAQLAIDHIRRPIVDRLYLEGLAIAITSQTINFARLDQKVPALRGTDKRIDRSIEFIHAHIASGMSVTDLASVAHMSPSWFARSFKSHTGMTVHAYVLKCRLERAHISILTSNESIGNIALACGFADHSHLTRLFKRKYGLTPRKMRD